jgi:hypothetical protein
MIPLSPSDRAVSRYLHLHPGACRGSAGKLAAAAGVTSRQASRALVRLGHREPEIVREWRTDPAGRMATVGRLLDACEHLPGDVSCREIQREHPRRKGVLWPLSFIRDLRGYFDPHARGPVARDVWDYVDWTLCSRGISRMLGVSVDTVQDHRREMSQHLHA